jgi:hypothetical protein
MTEIITLRDSTGQTKGKIQDLKEFEHPKNIFFKRSESFIGLYFINSEEQLDETHESIMALKKTR